MVELERDSLAWDLHFLVIPRGKSAITATVLATGPESVQSLPRGEEVVAAVVVAVAMVGEVVMEEEEVEAPTVEVTDSPSIRTDTDRHICMASLTLIFWE